MAESPHGPLLRITLYHALYIPPGEEVPPPEIMRVLEFARYVNGWMQRPGDSGIAVEQYGKPIGAAWLR